MYYANVLLLDVQSISRMEISGQGEKRREDQLLRRDRNSTINPLYSVDLKRQLVSQGLLLIDENESSILE